METLVEDNTMVPFSIAIILRCRENATPFTRLLHFTLDPYLIMLGVKQGGIKYNFLSVLGLNPGLQNYWRTFYHLGKWPGIYIYIMLINIFYSFIIRKSVSSLSADIWFMCHEKLGTVNHNSSFATYRQKVPYYYYYYYYYCYWYMERQKEN